MCYIGFTQFYPWVKLTVLPSFTQFYPTGFTHWVKRTCQPCVTDALAILHWLPLPEPVNFKLSLMAYRVLHCMAPAYLNQLVPVSDLPSRHRLRSSSTLQLLVPPYHLTTIGRRSFPVAASIVWNSLSVHLQFSPSLFTFRHISFTSHSPISSFDIAALRYRGLLMAICHFSHVKKHWLIDRSIADRRLFID